MTSFFSHMANTAGSKMDAKLSPMMRSNTFGARAVFDQFSFSQTEPDA